jgi:hypothetical protein
MPHRHKQPSTAEQSKRVMDCLHRDGRVSAEMLHCLGINAPDRVVRQLRNEGQLIRIVKTTDQANKTDAVYFLEK